MAKQVLALVLLCCAGVAVQGRLLQQNQRCPAGCATDGCVLDSTSGGYKCIKCQGTLTVNSDDGTCGCPAGRYAGDSTCLDCAKGSYCLGGTYTGANLLPAMTACPGTDQLTTIGKRSTSLKACVNVPGTAYSVTADGTPSSITCPVDTYGPGLRKQRACVPCPPGYTTNNREGSTSTRACVVPEGYYLKGPGQVAPCPKGEYKAGFDALPSCTKCAAGVSTPAEASTSESACTEVLPTFYPASIVSGIVKTTAKCPQKFYCPGGQPTLALNPAAINVTGTTVEACADGTWTENIGASSADQCMTPPGHKTTGGATTECADGEYRAEWKPAGQASSCLACGDNILSSATEQITVYAPTDAAATPLFVRATSAACYIKPGQGMYFSAASSTYRAVNCDANNYGVANTTYGLAAFPCRDCPSGMQTSTGLDNSNRYYVSDGAGKQGFISPMACVTQAGYGYNGRLATKCPAGSYNAAGNYGTCTKCLAGLTTADNATLQVTGADCGVAPGFGSYNGAIVPCPVGTYNDLLRAVGTACQSCDAGFTTSQAGADQASDCNMCAVGYGGTTCATQCGGSAGATYGPAGRQSTPASESACLACPVMTTGFSFDYLAQNQNFTPGAVARAGADSPADCLAEFAQIADAAWYMGGAVSLSAVGGVSTFADCVANCKGDDNCMYITFDYDASTCEKKTWSAPASSGSVLAFKAVVAGDTTAASLKNGAKALASGSYTFWNASDAGVGASHSAVSAGSIQACLSACDNDAACAAVSMTGITSASATPASCNLIRGDPTIAVFKRSVTKAVAAKLTVAAAL